MEYLKKTQSGFTLIELSIVLVIIGLIVGGVLVGQELINAAKLRKLNSDKETYITAVNAFKLKYNCLPGDCPNATAFFSGTSNGDGNYQIYNYSDEQCSFWQQLQLAGLIAGRYTGNCNGGYFTAGVNVPTLSINENSYFRVSYVGNITDIYNHSYPLGNYGNPFMTVSNCTTSQWCGGSVFTGQDALLVDKKFDDGSPYKGLIRGYRSSGSCEPDPAYSGTSGSYVTSSTNNCNLIFVTGF